ncbi:MAG: hypothetical protein HKN13_03480 [Rhodothermales bacterium]|nr:hypothetical protein [Rhodothermales bacterium]
MADLRLRPRFTHHVDAEAPCILKTIAQASTVKPIRSSIIDSSAILRVDSGSEKVWSPQLEVTFESVATGGCNIHGLFGPRPSVWTSFVAGYLLFLCIAFVSFMFGMTSYWLGMDARMLIVVPVAMAGMVALFGVARVGRRMGRAQMDVLFDCLKEAVTDCEDSAPRSPVAAG